MRMNAGKKESSVFTEDDFLDFSAYRHLKVEAVNVGDWGTITKVVGDRHANTLFQIETRLFNCCGTSSFERMDYEPSNPEALQEAVTLMCQQMQYWEIVNSGFSQSPEALFVVTESFKDHWARSGDIFTWLMNHGAEEVGHFPNGVHGPEELYLFKWNPKRCQLQMENEGVIWFNTDHSFIPYYARELWENEINGIEPTGEAIPEQAPQVEQRGLGGADGVQHVGPPQRVGVPKLDPIQNLQEQANQRAANIDAWWNPANQGVQAHAVEGVPVNHDATAN